MDRLKWPVGEQVFGHSSLAMETRSDSNAVPMATRDDSIKFYLQTPVEVLESKLEAAEMSLIQDAIAATPPHRGSGLESLAFVSSCSSEDRKTCI